MISWTDRLTRFNRWGPDANPLIRRVKNRPVRVSLRAALWLAFGLGMGGLAGSMWLLLYTTSDAVFLLELVTTLLGSAVIRLAPLVTAVLAVFQTAHDLGAGQDDLLRITPLPARAVIKAQVFAVLYRLRVFYVLVIGLTPPVVIGGLYILISFNAMVIQASLRLPHYPPLPPGEADEWFVNTLLTLSKLLILWAANLLAAAEGVKLGLLWRNTRLAALSAFGWMLVSMYASSVALNSIHLKLLELLGDSPRMVTLSVLVPMALLPLLIGALAAAIIRYTAWRWRV